MDSIQSLIGTIKPLIYSLKPHLHGRLFCERFFDKNGSEENCIYSTAVSILIIGTLTDGNNCLALFSY